MAKPTNCTIKGIQEQEAQEHINRKVSEIEIEVDTILDHHFGRVFDRTTSLNNTINAKNKSIRDKQARLQYVIKNKTPNFRKESRVLKDKIKQERRDLNKAKKDKKDFSKKQVIGKKLVNMLKERMMKSGELHAWNIDVQDIVGVLKQYLVNRMGPFRSIDELTYLELNAKYNMLKKWFANQDKGIMPKGFKGQGLKSSYQYTMVDPAKVIMMNDPTLKGLSLIKEIQDNLPNKSERKSRFRKKLANIQDKLSIFLYNNNIVYENDGRTFEELTQSEKTENTEKINELISDLLDGRTKYVIPRKIQVLLANKALLKKYASIVGYANDSGFNISKDIHEVTEGDDVYYYVTLKTKDSNTGREAYNAFIVPHYIDDNGRTKFYYPFTKKGVMNGNFLSNIPGNLKDAKDMPDVMRPGFRQAQVDKIFNGFNKNQNEIQTKGYAQYVPIDLDIDHPMFNESIIYKGTSQASVNSLWLHVKDTRELLQEIFDDWQELSKGALKRVAATINSHDGLKQMLMNKGQLDGNLDETTANILNVIDFNSMLWIDPKTGEVNSANITSGIKENYYPAMFDETVGIAQLATAIDGMMNEVPLLEDKISQLKNLKSKTNDPKELASLQKALIRADKKLKEYVGVSMLKEDGTREVIPGVIEIMKHKLNLSLGREDQKDAPKISAQSMIAYGKHRNLHTRRIKSLEPGTIYGGKRTDANVINEYIDTTYETVYNNILRAALLESVPTLNPAVLNYLVEEVKAAIGRHDVKSGILGLDYSNDKIMSKIQKVFPNTKMTVERLHEIFANVSGRISGSLLGISTGLQNRMQEVMGGVIEIEADISFKIAEILKNKQLAEEIAQKAGVLDTIQTLSDVFLGGLESQLGFWDGFHTTKDVLLLKGQDKLKFIKGAKGIRQQLINLIKTREGDKTEILKESIDSLMEGTFELVHGIAEGTLNDEQLKALEKKLNRILTQQYIRWYAQWGMGAFGIDKVAGLVNLKEYLSMTKGEESMRTIMAVRGVVFYADHIADPENRGDYTHPDALEYARGLVNNTLFQFSTQYFPKIFRGIGGMLTMKFKTYYYMESKRELEILNNFYQSLQGIGPGRAAQEIRKLLLPTKGFPLIGYSPQDVHSFRFDKKGKFPWVNRDNYGTDSDTERLRSLLWSRGMASIWTVGIFGMITPLKKLGYWAHQRFTISPSTIGRGAESTVISLGLRGFRLMLAGMFLGNEEDEENQDALQLYRIFFPIYLNVVMDYIKSGDPTKISRIFSGWASESLGYLAGVFTDEE